MKDLVPEERRFAKQTWPAALQLFASCASGEMFGYSTQMRSLTQGRGSFSMEPYDYQPAKSWSEISVTVTLFSHVHVSEAENLSGY